jgi:hypothetical protein
MPGPMQRSEQRWDKILAPGLLLLYFVGIPACLYGVGSLVGAAIEQKKESELAQTCASDPCSCYDVTRRPSELKELEERQRAAITDLTRRHERIRIEIEYRYDLLALDSPDTLSKARALGEAALRYSADLEEMFRAHTEDRRKVCEEVLSKRPPPPYKPLR